MLSTMLCFGLIAFPSGTSIPPSAEKATLVIVVSTTGPVHENKFIVLTATTGSLISWNAIGAEDWRTREGRKLGQGTVVGDKTVG